MDIDLYTTTSCNLRCIYCYQGRHTPEQEALYRRMKAFDKPISLDDAEEAVIQLCSPGDFVCFTGGEPLVNPDWMLAVMQRVEKYRVRFGLFTNGTLIHRTPVDLLRRLDQVQISLDGPADIHNQYRGPDVYEKALEGRRLLEQVWEDYPHHSDLEPLVWARMTVPPTADLFYNLSGLAEDYDHIYWQFQNGPDLDPMDVKARVEQTNRVIDLWLERLRTDDRLWLAPLETTIDAIRKGGVDKGPDNIGCGCKAGWYFISVFSDGNYYDCPEQIMQSYARLGSIKDGLTTIHNVPDVPQAQHCLKCPEWEICGTRCLYYSGGDYCRVLLPYYRRMREVEPTISDVHIEQPPNFEAVF